MLTGWTVPPQPGLHAGWGSEVHLTSCRITKETLERTTSAPSMLVRWERSPPFWDVLPGAMFCDTTRPSYKWQELKSVKKSSVLPKIVLIIRTSTNPHNNSSSLGSEGQFNKYTMTTTSTRPFYGLIATVRSVRTEVSNHRAADRYWVIQRVLFWKITGMQVNKHQR